MEFFRFLRLVVGCLAGSAAIGAGRQVSSGPAPGPSRTRKVKMLGYRHAPRPHFSFNLTKHKKERTDDLILAQNDGHSFL